MVLSQREQNAGRTAALALAAEAAVANATTGRAPPLLKRDKWFNIKLNTQVKRFRKNL